MKRSIRRRRLEAKTDYKARLNMLTSEKPRLVIRKTNRYIIAQLVTTKDAQDHVVLTVTSADLLTQGWSSERKGSLKSLPAAYLTGLLLAKRLNGKFKNAILDIGMHRNIHKSRIYAAVEGAREGGLAISCKEEILPGNEMIQSNKELRALFTKVKSTIEHG